MIHKLTIERSLPSLNQYIDASRRNRFVGAKMKKDAEQYIGVFVQEQLKGVAIICPVSIHFAFYEPNRKRDPDNVLSYFTKVALDCLVARGVIPNDSQQWIKGLSYEFHVDRSSPRIEIQITEVGT